MEKKYKYEIGNIITDVHFGKLKILEQIRMSNGKNTTIRGYEYQCLICSNKDTISEAHLKEHKGCNVCSNQKVLKGYNDMWTTNSKLASLLANPEDGYKYMQSSNKHVDWICSKCGSIIKNKSINMTNQHGLSCPNCNDKLPYPEKFVFNVLKQLLGDDFTYQLTNTTFKWCNKYRYDFYFKINNEEYVLETHGLQHYEEGFYTHKGQSLKNRKKNDRLKKELALKNNIKEDNYIVIDCRYSILEWIKEHIQQSRLNNIFDLSKIDWLKCHKQACNSLVREACKLWNKGIHSTVKIGKIMKLSTGTIIKYLDRGNSLNWCEYHPTQGRKREIICLNNNKIYKSITDATNSIGINSASIGLCCNDKRRTGGRNAETGEWLQWQYYDEYLIKPKKLLTNDELHKSRKKSNEHKIICLNDNRIFESITEAAKFYKIKSQSSISDCCREKCKSCKSAGKDPITDEPLHWKYYENYIKSKNKQLKERN